MAPCHFVAFILWLSILLKGVSTVIACLVLLGRHPIGYSEASASMNLFRNDRMDLRLLCFTVFRIILPVRSTRFRQSGCRSVWADQCIVLRWSIYWCNRLRRAPPLIQLRRTLCSFPLRSLSCLVLWAELYFTSIQCGVLSVLSYHAPIRALPLWLDVRYVWTLFCTIWFDPRFLVPPSSIYKYPRYFVSRTLSRVSCSIYSVALYSLCVPPSESGTYSELSLVSTTIQLASQTA